MSATTTRVPGFLQPVRIDLARARQLWVAGVPVADIAQALGCSRQNVAHHAHTRGWGKRRPGAGGKPAIDWRAVARRIADGHPVDAIAADVGCARSTIRNRVARGTLPAARPVPRPRKAAAPPLPPVRRAVQGGTPAVPGPVTVRCADCGARYPLPDADAPRDCPHCHRADARSRTAA